MKSTQIHRRGKGHGLAIPAQAHLRSKLSASGRSHNSFPQRLPGMKSTQIHRRGKGHGLAIPAQAHLRSKLSASGRSHNSFLKGYQV